MKRLDDRTTPSAGLFISAISPLTGEIDVKSRLLNSGDKLAGNHLAVVCVSMADHPVRAGKGRGFDVPVTSHIPHLSSLLTLRWAIIGRRC